jgi:hypothetical protein
MLGKAVSDSYKGKTGILPATRVVEIELIRTELLEVSYGVGITGAGGGGYLTVITEDDINNSIKPLIRRS